MKLKHFQKEQRHMFLGILYPDVKAILINYLDPGLMEKFIYLIFHSKRIFKFINGKQCYIEPSKNYLKNAAVNRIGVVLTNSDYTLRIINPLTGEPLNDANKVLSEDLKICSPVSKI